MAIEYTYYLSGANLSQVARVVSRTLNQPPETNGSLVTFRDTLPTITLTKPSQHPEILAFHHETLGFEPALGAHFRLDKNNLTANETSLVKIVSALSSRFPGPSILVFNGEKPILKQLDGQVILNSDTTFWSSERLQLIGSYDARLPMKVF